MPAEKKELNVQIGQRIRRAREERGYTQEKLAELVGVSVQYTSDLERGKVGASVATIVRLCRALEVSSDFLLFGSSPVDANAVSQYLAGLNDTQLAIAADALRLLRRAFAADKPES